MTTESAALKYARSRWVQRRRALIQEGRWQPYVSAQPVRDHVNAIRATGMSAGRISERTGVGVGTLNVLLFGGHGYPPADQIRKESADILLGFWPTLDDYADNALISSIGTLRRTQALATMGWGGMELARRSGRFRRNALYRMRPDLRVSAYLARAVRDLYNELADQPAEQAGVYTTSATRARVKAARAGFAGPIAWDDDTIDDPAAHPNWTGHCGTDRGFWMHRLQKIPVCQPCEAAHETWKAEHAHLDGRARAAAAHAARCAASNRGPALAEDGRELLRLGCDYDEAATRLGVTRQHLQQELSRHPERTAA